MAATLDGTVEATGAVFETKCMLPWSFSEEGAPEKIMPQLQHNMWATNARSIPRWTFHSRRRGDWLTGSAPYDPLLFDRGPPPFQLVRLRQRAAVVARGETALASLGTNLPAPDRTTQRVAIVSSRNPVIEFVLNHRRRGL
jgi:hypothetical protein